jgi:hypothetical protein
LGIVVGAIRALQSSVPIEEEPHSHDRDEQSGGAHSPRQGITPTANGSDQAEEGEENSEGQHKGTCLLPRLPGLQRCVSLMAGLFCRRSLGQGAQMELLEDSLLARVAFQFGEVLAGLFPLVHRLFVARPVLFAEPFAGFLRGGRSKAREEG